MKKVYLIFIVGFFCIMYSCTYNEYIPEYIPPIDTTVVYSFNDTIQPIFDAKCTSCHGTSGGINLEADFSYNNIVPDRINQAVPEESMIYEKPLPTGSHPAKYTGEESQLVLEWIKQGTKNN